MAQNEPEHTLPVFVQNNSLPAFDKKDFSTAEICSDAEKTTGFNSIIPAEHKKSAVFGESTPVIKAVDRSC